MSLINLIISFGGGVFASLIGGTVAFIFTGITGLIGIAIIIATGNDAFLNTVAFGPFFGPPIAFFGAVAATAYAGRRSRNHLSGKKKYYMEPMAVEGENVLKPMFATKEPSVLIVGGLFGMLGYSLNYLFSMVLHLPIDTGGLTVMTGGIIARLMFGESGLLGKYPENEVRYGDMTPKFNLFTLIWGFFIGTLTGQVCIMFDIPSIGFAISAVTLIFSFFDNEFTSSHHVTMIAGYAALTFANPYMGGLFGALAAISGEYIGRTFNTHVDSHLDREGTTIALWSFIILGLLSKLV